ncbi:hypothetical protein ASC97_21685 [Rhizobium sp. Root1203]|uniref:hypothetical protein n=1 Tax=Rhizobium sp. Root1203 TaxID=1736427 RepID=UPI000709E755|nr:hypothetical protein [Rhizobium sp. Root1203]KQV30450.1 hypothetical protein ASC97_21685 [Rhizobium sp. Root1203]
MPTKPEVKIERLEPRTVVAPLLVPTSFKLIGYGLSKEIYVYLSTREDGGDDVSNPDGSADASTYKIKIVADDSSTSTDRVLSLIAKPELDALPINQPLFVAVRLNGKFEDAQPTFRLA